MTFSPPPRTCPLVGLTLPQRGQHVGDTAEAGVGRSGPLLRDHAEDVPGTRRAG